MVKSELLEDIREEYLQAHPEIAVGPVDDFCQFVVTWLAENGVVGVGHTPSGLALRLADGTEKVLVSVDAPLNSVDTPAMAIGRGGVSARQGIGGGDTSVSITNS